MAIVEFENVTRLYRSGEHELRALDDVSFTLEAGKFVVILGPSGAGKSTLLNLLGGLDSPTSGTIRVSGRDISTLSGKELADYRAAAVGFVFQFYNLIPPSRPMRTWSWCRRSAPTPWMRRKFWKRWDWEIISAISPPNSPAGSSSGCLSPEPW